MKWFSEATKWWDQQQCLYRKLYQSYDCASLGVLLFTRSYRHDAFDINSHYAASVYSVSPHVPVNRLTLSFICCYKGEVHYMQKACSSLNPILNPGWNWIIDDNLQQHLIVKVTLLGWHMTWQKCYICSFKLTHICCTSHDLWAPENCGLHKSLHFHFINIYR